MGFGNWGAKLRDPSDALRSVGRVFCCTTFLRMQAARVAAISLYLVLCSFLLWYILCALVWLRVREVKNSHRYTCALICGPVGVVLLLISLALGRLRKNRRSP